MRFSSDIVLCFCVCACKCICRHILAAEWAYFMSLLNQLCEYSKSYMGMAHTIYWNGRNYYTVIIQNLYASMLFNLSYVGYFQLLFELTYCCFLIAYVLLSKHLINATRHQYFSLPLQQLNYNVLCKYCAITNLYSLRSWSYTLAT